MIMAPTTVHVGGASCPFFRVADFPLLPRHLASNEIILAQLAR